MERPNFIVLRHQGEQASTASMYETLGEAEDLVNTMNQHLDNLRAEGPAVDRHGRVEYRIYRLVPVES